MSEAEKRLRDAMPFIKLAIAQASIAAPTHQLKAALLAQLPSGSGHIVCDFEASFFEDVAELLGVKDRPGWMSPEDEDA